jgi:nucleoid-associated protein YgaU
VAGPLAAAVPSPPVASAAVPDRSAPVVPDWTGAPDRPDQPVPDWPEALPDVHPAPAPGAHVVVRGDCLWSIAGTRLTAALGRTPSAAEVATAVEAWWAANAAVIGPDPDLLLPGQVLRPPPLP